MARSAIVPQIPFTYPALDTAPLVLCVDDEPAILELLEDVLTACGLRPICTDDCDLALRLAGEPIDLVVLDYHMPAMDGLTLAKKIHEQKSDLPLIFFSGAPLPMESMATASRVVNKGEGVMRLANAILESIATAP